MEKVYYDNDADTQLLKGKKIVVVGYGSQGKAQAKNIKDSGFNVTVALRPRSPSLAKAERDGLLAQPISDAIKGADLVQMLLPDVAQPKVYKEFVAPALKPGSMLMFSHGFNIHYKQINPPDFVDVAMVAPKGPGHLVREMFVKGAGVPCLVAIAQDVTNRAKDIALSYAKAIGGTRAGVIETTFSEETETDLFGEQVVLCGGVTELVVAAFETLVEAGYQPEAAYFECLHELKLIVDLLYEGGLARLHEFVSDTAKYGDLTRGPRIVNHQVRQEMKLILEEVQSGAFATEWILENQAGLPKFSLLMKRDLEHPIENVGRKLRSMMPWFNQTTKNGGAYEMQRR